MNAVAASPWKRFVGRMVHGGASILLLFFLAVSLVFSIYDARWVAKIQSIPYALLGGLLFGALLAASRWKGVIATFYSVVLSFIYTFLVVGGILPSISRLFTQPFLSEVEGMRLRMLAFALRSNGWIESLRSGGKVDDTGLFLFFFSFVGWNVIVWLIWWALRRGQPLVGTDSGDKSHGGERASQRATRDHPGVFPLSLIANCGAGEFHRETESWARRGVDFSEDLGGDWGSSAVASAFLIGVIALVFSLVGTPEGWRAINDLVERSRREMAETAEQLFSGVNPPPRSAGRPRRP